MRDDEGLKFDIGKKSFHAMPLNVLEGLADVFNAGVSKGYPKFNCLKPFDNSNVRFYDAAMRHIIASQIDPLAVDEETGCRHGYMAAWNLIFRTYHAEQESK
jgi:hypothetical protein